MLKMFLLDLSKGRTRILCEKHLFKGTSYHLSPEDLQLAEAQDGQPPYCWLCGRRADGKYHWQKNTSKENT